MGVDYYAIKCVCRKGERKSRSIVGWRQVEKVNANHVG